MKGLLILTVFVLAAATACGGEEAEKEKAGKQCGPAPAAMTQSPKLSAGFPKPSGVTYTTEEQKGPSEVVHGFFSGDIDASFSAYKSALGTGGYNVTKSEHEEIDAEVNFAGGGSSGQVKLVQECKDRTTVTITSRPA